MTLNIETPVLITKTNVQSFPRVWSINDFVDPPWNIQSESRTVNAVQKLLREFVKNYKFANPDQKPTFYVYF